jgi:hypothetical protein
MYDCCPLQEQQEAAAQLPCVTKATITLLEPPNPRPPDPKLPPDAHAACLAAYCSALWGALPGLQQLALEWPNTVALLPLLPAVSTLQQLRDLKLGRWADTMRPPPAVVSVQEVLQAVQGATQLQKLTIALELAPGSSKDQLVLGLQEALPQLTHLEVPCQDEGEHRCGEAGCDEPNLQPATRAALRPGLKLRRAV